MGLIIDTSLHCSGMTLPLYSRLTTPTFTLGIKSRVDENSEWASDKHLASANKRWPAIKNKQETSIPWAGIVDII